MEMTSGEQLAQLRAISDSEVVISEPVFTDTPGVVWVSVLIGAIAVTGVWAARRTRRMLSAAG